MERDREKGRNYVGVVGAFFYTLGTSKRGEVAVAFPKEVIRKGECHVAHTYIHHITSLPTYTI